VNEEEKKALGEREGEEERSKVERWPAELRAVAARHRDGCSRGARERGDNKGLRKTGESSKNRGGWKLGEKGDARSCTDVLSTMHPSYCARLGLWSCVRPCVASG